MKLFQINSDPRQIIGLLRMEFLLRQRIILMINRNKHLRPTTQHLLHRIIHQPIHNRSPLIEMKSVRGINHLRFRPVSGNPCDHTTDRAVTVTKRIGILLHQSFHLPQRFHVLSHMPDIPREINLVAAHMHVLRFCFVPRRAHPSRYFPR